MSAQAHAADLPGPRGLGEFQPETLVLRDVAVDDATPQQHISVFGDDTWHLYPMALNPASYKKAVAFASSPLAFRETLKRLVWCMINLPTPLGMLERPTSIRSRLTPNGIAVIFAGGMRPFTQWLEQRGIDRLCDAGDAVLRNYADYIAAQPCTRGLKAQRLWGVTRIWLLAPYLPDEDRIEQPPWEPHGLHELLGPANWSPENKTPPIHPQTMSALLLWALRFVHDFSEDILAAARAHDGMTARKCHRHTRSIDTPIRGQIHGEPWTDSIDADEVDHLVRLLAGACMVVIAYLSGMRAGECLALRRGCCRRAKAGGDGTGGFEIVARTFKGALDADGNAIPGGVVRDHPWHVVEPVKAAVEMLERLHPHDLLLAAAVFNPKQSGDRAAPHYLTKLVIEQLVAWCNETAARVGRPDEAIPADPEGPVTMRRFRRTLAWFIYRLPAGRISLGIQYGHLQPHITDGYGSRMSAGLRGVFPMEEALARAERLSDAADRLDAGETVSGPARDRYIAGVAEFSHTYRGRVLPPNGYKQLLKNPKLRIFDNGVQPVACCYDATKALCHPENQRSPNMRRSPNLTRCNLRCGNVARTDTHVEEIRVEIGRLDKQRSSTLTPQPMQQAFGQRIETLQNIIDAHEQDRIPARTMPKRNSNEH